MLSSQADLICLARGQFPKACERVKLLDYTKSFRNYYTGAKYFKVVKNMKSYFESDTQT